MSGTRFGFDTREEAADPTLTRNPPIENEEPNITPLTDAKECDTSQELVCKVCFDAQINALTMPCGHCFGCLACTNEALFKRMSYMSRDYFGCKSYLYCIIKTLDCIQFCLLHVKQLQ